MGAGSREKMVARRCGVDSLGRCCGATNVSVSAMMSGLWLSVRSLSAVTCSEVSIERVDEEVCRVGGT